uniref:Uncharacterized protein n=2 Tax=Panagrolaimus sp. PS1159 TaxID=55785 RepID=A0AC35GG22_9BILA
MFKLVVYYFILYWNFCGAEYYQDEPMGHFMEYSVEMPSSRSQTSEPTMFMRYGNIDKSGRYLRDFEIQRPNNNYRHQLPPNSEVEEEYSNPSMPPFPFSLPYQYIDTKIYPKPGQQPYHNRPWNIINNDKPWNNNNEREYPPVLENNRNSWARVYPSRDNYHHHREPQQYFEPHQTSYVPTRYTSTVDEIQNRVFSMMQNIGTFPSSPQNRGGQHRTGYSRESQYGYQMFI